MIISLLANNLKMLALARDCCCLALWTSYTLAKKDVANAL